jgi:hypothetical protein
MRGKRLAADGLLFSIQLDSLSLKFMVPSRLSIRRIDRMQPSTQRPCPNGGAMVVAVANQASPPDLATHPKLLRQRRPGLCGIGRSKWGMNVATPNAVGSDAN